MNRQDRRTFLKAAAASAAFPMFTISGTRASGRVIGANERIRMGVAGIRGRGGSHIDGFAEQDLVDVTYLIDPDKRLWQNRIKQVEEKGGNTPTCVQDIRQALDNKSLDAVSVATCNHWHSLITVWGCQAGKDVYVEKPISHNVFEGRQCVKAAEKYGRVVQHGTQQRSSETRARQMAAIQAGKYGKLLVSKGYCCKPRWSIGFKGVESPPPELDWNLWLGPAQQQAYHGNLHPYEWHWFWPTGNGDIGNQGVHEIDVARWAIKDATLPRSVWAFGGRYVEDGKDQAETPNMQGAVYDYGDTLLVFETRGLVEKNGGPKRKVANEFYTDQGVVRDWKFYPSDGSDPVAIEGDEATVTPGGPFEAFVAAVRSRRPEDNNAPAEVAHYSAALCHLANISYRLGRELPLTTAGPKMNIDPSVSEMFGNIKENLAAVGIDLAANTIQVGQRLEFDADQEQFTDNERANAMLTRDYRAPFIVPAEV